MCEEGSWEEVKVDVDYEIYTEYPYPIRKKGSDKPIKEHSDKDGYLIITLSGKKFKKHRVIAIQWIPNPDDLPCIDHKNRITSDYHIENLRWVSFSENAKNRSTHNETPYEYVDKLSDEAIEVNTYGTHTYENFYFYEDEFYVWNGISYRKLFKSKLKNGSVIVRAFDTDGNKTVIYYTKFKKLYEL